VDDHALVRRGMSHVVRESFTAAEIVEAATASEALEAMVSSQIDVALVDVRMPDSDGLDLLHDASGDGDLSAEVALGAVTSVSGGGTFASGGCDFEFDFDGLSPEILEGGGFGSGSVGFDLGVGSDSVGGSIVLDGTNVAAVTATRAGGARETFLVDLTTGAVTPQ